MSQVLAPVVAPPDDLVHLGRVSGSYGVRGWVKIEPVSAQSAVLLAARQWWVQRDPNMAPVAWSIVQSRPQGATIVAHVQGLTQREQAVAWKGASVLVSRAQFPPPDADEFYWVDLIGCHVQGQTDDGDACYLGQVEQVSDNGAHGVLHVVRQATPDATEPLRNARGQVQHVLVPFVAAHVLAVHLDQRQILTNWPPDV